MVMRMHDGGMLSIMLFGFTSLMLIVGKQRRHSRGAHVHHQKHGALSEADALIVVLTDGSMDDQENAIYNYNNCTTAMQNPR